MSLRCVAAPVAASSSSARSAAVERAREISARLARCSERDQHARGAGIVTRGALEPRERLLRLVAAAQLCRAQQRVRGVGAVGELGRARPGLRGPGGVGEHLACPRRELPCRALRGLAR